MKQFTSKNLIATISSVVLLAITAVIMLGIGSAQISVGTIIAIFAHKFLPLGNAGGDIPAAFSKIVLDIRWPRIALAILVGSSLAVAGACYQAMFRNPLADPFILGVSSGAALGAAIAIVLKQTAYIGLYAFAGGAATIFLVYKLGGGNSAGMRTNQLLLAGVALGSMLNALLSALMALHTQQVGAILFWLLGSLTNPQVNLGIIAVMVGIGLVVIMVFARDLDVMTAGDENAQFLGVDVAKVKVILLLSTTLITSAVVAVSGVIGFIGLIVPHILRRIFGPQHTLLIPMCAVWGGIFLLWSDGLTRMFFSLSQVPVGVITALLGSPFFLYILYITSQKR